MRVHVKKKTRTECAHKTKFFKPFHVCVIVFVLFLTARTLITSTQGKQLPVPRTTGRTCGHLG